MEASYLTGLVTRQRRDPGCYIKVLFWRLMTVYMGQGGQLAAPRSRQKEPGSRLGELTIVPYKHFFPARRDKILLKARVFCIDKRKWRKLVLNPSEQRNGKRKEKKHFRWSDEMHPSLIECLTNTDLLIFDADISEAHINTIN